MYLVFLGCVFLCAGTVSLVNAGPYLAALHLYLEDKFYYCQPVGMLK